MKQVDERITTENCANLRFGMLDHIVDYEIEPFVVHLSKSDKENGGCADF